ncbi:MAG: DUF6056 family protein [Bacteroidales bacterium]|nr:DUF6056 family protein [Bacteroidales bacterium]
MGIFLKNIIKNKNLALLIHILLLLPVFILCIYIHPSADDFIYSSWYKAPVSVNFWEYHKGNYLTWNGRYFSTLLLTINPLVFGSFTGYKILAIVMLLFFYGALYAFFKTIFNTLDVKAVHIISLLIMISYLNIVPSLSETVYWMSATLTYFLAWAMTLLMWVFILKYYHSNTSKRNAIVVLLLAFCVIGSNELSAFLTGFTGLGLIILKVLKNKKPDAFSLLFFTVSIILILIVILAPGNNNRLNFFENHYNINFAITNTFYNFFKITILHIKNPAIISLCFLSFLNAHKLLKSSQLFQKIKNFNPLFFLISVVCIILFFYFTSAFNMGIQPPLRVHGFISFLVILSLAFFAILLNQKHQFLVLEANQLLKINSLLIGVFCFFVLTDFHKKDGENYYIKGNIMLAVYDLTHDAPKFNHALNNRYKLIQQAKREQKTSLSLPVLPYKPRSIFFADIKPDSLHWINWGNANYFDLKYINTFDERAPYQNEVQK